MAFTYVDNKLSVTNGNQVVSVDACNKDGEPYYLYDLDGIEARVNEFKESFKRPITMHYAMKANDNAFLLKVLSGLGVGVDVVSGGEVSLALEAGFTADKIVFSGVGKTVKELELAIESQIKQINVESPAELRRICQVASRLKKTARVAFRMNPDVEAETHPYITTGFRENKFGMDRSFLPELEHILEQEGEFVELSGLTLHIGSQLRNIDPVIEAIEKTKAIHRELLEKGYKLSTFDVGGGLGMSYEEGSLEQDSEAILDYGKRVSEVTSDLDVEVLCEPGRIIVARFGVLVGEVQYIKESPYKSFAIVNTGMHHILRPCLYQAYHRILPLEKKDRPNQLYDVVGPICESSDVLGKDRALPVLEAGDLLAVADSGAYGYVMASTYNKHALPEEYVFYKGELKRARAVFSG